MNGLEAAVILSAGCGTRMLPLTASTPKVMLPVEGTPLLELHVRALATAGITDICLNLHAHPDLIRDHFGDGAAFGVRMHYAVEPELRGTAGALNGFRDILRGRFLVQYGDVYSQLDIGAMNDYHRRSGAAATLAVHPSAHPYDSDMVETRDGRITALHHKPGTVRYGRMGNAGCYVMEPVALASLPEQGASDFIQDLFPAMLHAGLELVAYHTCDLMFDMGTLERYQALGEKLRAPR